MVRTVRRLQKASNRSVRALQFALAPELEWPAWALATRAGRSVPNPTSHQRDVNLIDYSQASFTSYNPLPRTEWLFHALAAIPDGPRDSMLIIGPRFANERFLARGLGFRADSIKMLDLFSYSKWVDAGNMHEMPYASGQFSFVVCGWTLAYSSNPQLAAEEMSRVLRPGGYLIFGMDVENASSEPVAGWKDLVELFPALTPLARLEAAGNLVAVLQKEPELTQVSFGERQQHT